MRVKKAQVSVEFLLVSGFIMMIMMGSLVLVMNFAKTSTDEFITKSVNSIGNTMVNNAELLGVYGNPARKVLEFSFPPRISNMSVENDHYLFFEVQTRAGSTKYYGFYSSYNISADFKEKDYIEGKHRFLLEVNSSAEEVRIERWVQ